MTHRLVHQRPSARRTRGMAALSVVMVLFFIMALVAAYTNRNLIFEQRVATNSYRSERALVAADAGSEWALMMLNSGRVSLSCQPSSSAADAPPRQRYLSRNDKGGYELTAAPDGTPLYPSCVNAGGALTCVCPTAANANPSPHAVKEWPVNTPGSAFRVLMQEPVGGNASGAVIIDVRGCGSAGSGEDSCASGNRQPLVDGSSVVRLNLGLVRALPAAPVAAITAGRNIDASATLLKLSNPDDATGLTAHAGAAVLAPAGSVLVGPAGSGDDGRLAGDAPLLALRPTVANRFTALDTFFRAMFGMEAPIYRRQPAVVRFDCTASACTMADLEAAHARYPGLTLWFDGNLTLAAAPASGTLGDATYPLAVIVNGQLGVQAAMDLTGFFYATGISWTGGANAAVVRGALVAVDDFTAEVPATVVYDSAALKTISQYYGSFVRAPGGWTRTDRN